MEIQNIEYIFYEQPIKIEVHETKLFTSITDPTRLLALLSVFVDLQYTR
jgi:hypothetical protein